jgi:hypothetical protein
MKAVPWLRQLVAGLSPRRPGFDPGSFNVGFVVDRLALGQVFPRVLRFSPVSFIPPVLHYTEKLIIVITGLHNKRVSCGASVVSDEGPFTKKMNNERNEYQVSQHLPGDRGKPRKPVSRWPSQDLPDTK